MNLQTKIPFKQQQHNQIDYSSEVLLLGSCFVENIGQKLDYFKFQNVQNPFGILFQPLAIENLMSNAVQEKIYTETDIFFHNEQWHCFDAHSKLSDSNKDGLLQDLNEQLQLTSKKLKSATHIVITLGTAWVYRNVESERVVANCHKIPQQKFSKELLSVEQIVESLKKIVETIQTLNPEVTFLFTVSPIRHLKDGFIENTQSKAHLISAIHSFLSSRLQSRDLHYFPSYELMMDELRDYRFYADDMIHPNQTAITYIWNAFKTVWISDEALKTMEMVETIQKGMQHKPFNPNSEAHQQFLQKLSDKKEKLKSSFPYISF